MVEEVREFCYLGDLLDSEGVVDRAVRRRVSAAWYMWTDISSLLIHKSLPQTEPESTIRVLDLCCCMALKAGLVKNG